MCRCSACLLLLAFGSVCKCSVLGRRQLDLCCRHALDLRFYSCRCWRCSRPSRWLSETVHRSCNLAPPRVIHLPRMPPGLMWSKDGVLTVVGQSESDSVHTKCQLTHSVGAAAARSMLRYNDGISRSHTKKAEGMSLISTLWHGSNDFVLILDAMRLA